MRYFLIHIYLLLGAYEDLKTKKIKIWYLWFGAIMGISYRITDLIGKEIQLYEWILCMLPGMLFLIFAKKEKEALGDGDGWFLIVLGNCFGVKRMWNLFGLSVFILSFYSFLLLFTKRADRKTQIPYLPFLWLSDIILWGLEYVT